MLSKISSYNFFNNLLPGVLFYYFAGLLWRYELPNINIITLFFIYYFTGMVIGRIGSLIFQPLLFRLGFLPKSKHHDFVNALRKYEKIEVLSETNNTYRTLYSLFGCLIILSLINSVYPLKDIPIFIFVFILFVLFLFSYLKQSRYIISYINIFKQE